MKEPIYFPPKGEWELSSVSLTEYWNKHIAPKKVVHLTVVFHPLVPTERPFQKTYEFDEVSSALWLGAFYRDYYRKLP
ncbi:MAG TPA: hypothetical protein VJM50_24675 [Pyrinomonadaceae bacterium]|nr:hypothetical protein [Pyrinomonadaceae bacterium]